jgi:hypothetical protein
MSAEATGYVYRFCPYRGTTFQVHHAVADSVNDQNDNKFWMRQGPLARKARCGREAANEALATLVTDGFIELLQQGGGRGRPSLYRFLFPDVPVIYDSRKVSDETTVSKVSGRPTVSKEVSDETTETPGKLSGGPGKTVVPGHRHITQEEPKKAFEPKKSRSSLPSAKTEAPPPHPIAASPSVASKEEPSPLDLATRLERVRLAHDSNTSARAADRKRREQAQSVSPPGVNPRRLVGGQK